MSAPEGTLTMPLLTAIADTGLDIARDQLEELFVPFVTEGPSSALASWQREVARRKRKLMKRALGRAVAGWRPSSQRSEETVLKEYSKAWTDIQYSAYSLTVPPSNPTPWEWHDKQMFAADTGATRVRQLLLIRLIEKLRPRSVLEVGCGNGINLLLLACRFPEIDFAGVELTEAGNKAATGFQEHEKLPAAMEGYAPLPLHDLAGYRRINFMRGNASDLALETGQFDLVYSVLALEQMEKIRSRALSEMARVSNQHVLMIEPFRDVNQEFWPRLYIYARNYFRGSIAELKTHGLTPEIVTNDFPQEAFLKVCLVLSRKANGAKPG